MRTFKLIDVWVSMVLILIFIVIGLIKPDYEYIIWGYFITGAWQVISMLVHAIKGWFCEKGGVRYNYHWSVVIVIMVTLLGLAIYLLLYLWLFALLFAAPLMAIGYTAICYKEVYGKMRRPLDFLK